ncbi:hypothetical protein WA026_018332 [Henosepilachna vigintioctopunctata]|uniref:Uncharacterized protein n=1 Tax=Henosepilachna vigintioctopunctata TaxID=420089 RepID=A0AAW1VAC6_9CUCU
MYTSSMSSQESLNIRNFISGTSEIDVNSNVFDFNGDDRWSSYDCANNVSDKKDEEGSEKGKGGGCGGGGGTGNNGAGGSGGDGKVSNPKSEKNRKKNPVPKKKSTTLLKPNPTFCNEKVRKILKNVAMELLDNSYCDIMNHNLSQKVISNVRKQVKDMKFDPRYKFVCFITVAERGEHNLPLTTRALWNPETDRCACFSHRTCTTYTTILCFGIMS